MDEFRAGNNHQRPIEKQSSKKINIEVHIGKNSNDLNDRAETTQKTTPAQPLKSSRAVRERFANKVSTRMFSHDFLDQIAKT